MNNLLPQVKGHGGDDGDDGYSNPFGSAASEDEAEAEAEASGSGSSEHAARASADEQEPESTAAAVTIAIVEEEGDGGGGGGGDGGAGGGGAKERAKSRWKAGIEMATVESKKKRQWVPDDDMVGFFKGITEIDEGMRQMEAEITQLEALHMKTQITTSLSVVREMRESMADHIQAASKTSKLILNKFSEIENTRKAKLSALSGPKLRMRLTIFNAKRKQFKKIMSKFSNLRLTVQADYKEIVIRRYKTVTGQVPTNEEVTNLIETGESETIFKKAILEQGRGQIQDTLNEIDERHRAMQEIERGLLELQQIFIDLATVVEQQSEVIDNIEVHVNTASDFTSEGAKALQISAALHKSIQRKKLCIAILIIIGVVVLALILWPIIKTAIDSANSANLAKAQRRQAAAEEARLRFDQFCRDQDAENKNPNCPSP